MKPIRIFLLLALLTPFSFQLSGRFVHAAGAPQWTENGIAVCRASNGQLSPIAVTDGSGGAILAWRDGRSGSPGLYTQRVSASGASQWTTNGIRLCSGIPIDLEIISDGVGGAIIVFHKAYGSGSLLAQRINGDGAKLWPGEGVVLASGDCYYGNLRASSDGVGGMLVSWVDFRASNRDIYAQRIDASGNTLWGLSGVAVCTAENDQYSYEPVSDGSGGAIITWTTFNSTTNTDLMAQRIDASGVILWGSEGISICSLNGAQTNPAIISDAAGGAIITWEDRRPGTNLEDIYAQHIGATGAGQWTTDGVPVCSMDDYQSLPKILSDGSGGFIIAWNDSRSGDYSEIFAQHLSSSGSRLWPAEGKSFFSGQEKQGDFSMISDGEHGAIIVWPDFRYDDIDLFSQKIDASGSTEWQTDGEAVCLAIRDQCNPRMMLSEPGKAIVVWEDSRSGAMDPEDIYAQQITQAPEAPSNLSPVDGSIDASLNPTMSASSFSSSYTAISHIATEWQVDGDFDFSSPGWTRISSSGETSTVVNNSNGDFVNELTGNSELEANTLYAWRVRYKNSNGIWTKFSYPSVFITCSPTWYLAEGCTEGGFETWVLVQNPGEAKAQIEIDFQTDSGLIPGPRDTVTPNTRRSYNVGSYVTTYNVSTKITASSGAIICERAMYGNERTWGHDSVGVTSPDTTWYLPEGCTDGGFETWVLVQNPGSTSVDIDMGFQTDTGALQGPKETIPANSRRSYNLGDFVTTYNVSTQVRTSGGGVICERAMYGNERTWGHDSVGSTSPSPGWFFAEGCTADGYETWILVQNPTNTTHRIELIFMDDNGPTQAVEAVVPGNSRMSFNVADFITTYNVSTFIACIDENGSFDPDGSIICERAMYGGSREWGHDSIGSPVASSLWCMAEGCTAGDFETWILVYNIMDQPVEVSLCFMTESGLVEGPKETVPAMSRKSYNVGEYTSSYEVSTLVVCTNGYLVCERSMYGSGRSWGHNSMGYPLGVGDFSSSAINEEGAAGVLSGMSVR